MEERSTTADARLEIQKQGIQHWRYKSLRYNERNNNLRHNTVTTSGDRKGVTGSSVQCPDLPSPTVFLITL